MSKHRHLEIPDEETQDRFWDKVDKDSQDCWIWKAATRADGVGVFGIGKLNYYAHRVAYVLSRGSIPPEMEVRKSCRNSACVRPLHLFLSPRDTPRDPELVGPVRYLI